MKLLTLNIALFEANNERLVRFLKSEKPDIACFQETTRSLDDGVLEKYISINAVDRATQDLKFNFFGPNDVFGVIELENFHGQKNFHFDPGGKLELGNYTKSRYPIIRAKSIFLEGHFSYETDQSSWPDDDYRSVVVVEINIGKRKLRVLNYHGIWTRGKEGNEKTLAACEKINQLASEPADGVIICGDFNLFPDTPSMKVFDKNFVSLVNRYEVNSTRPSSNELNGKKRNVVDYVLVGKNIKVNGFKAVETDVSDHLPLILDFEL